MTSKLRANAEQNHHRTDCNKKEKEDDDKYNFLTGLILQDVYLCVPDESDGIRSNDTESGRSWV